MRNWIIYSIVFAILTTTNALALPGPPLDRAFRLSKQGLWEDSIPYFQKALEADPGNQLAQANLGVAYSQVGKYKEAMHAYDAALSMGYDSANFRYLRGLALLKLELINEAEKEMETALKMNPLMPETLYDLGLVYILQNRNKDAMELVKKLYRRNHTLSEKLFHEIPSNYKVSSVDDGGVLTGTVHLTGRKPKPRVFHLIHAPNIKFCGRISDGMGHRILHDFVTGPNGELQETVIAIRGLKKGKPFNKKMQTFHIDRCRANNYAIGIMNGEELLIENTDPIRHEIATYQFYKRKVRQTSNKPVTPRSSQIRSAFVKPGSEEFIIKCNLHPFLQTHGLFVDNPYYTITDEKGQFKIDDIPPGTYEVTAWHPYLPASHGTITIESGKSAALNFEFKSTDIRRKLYSNDTKGYRFNTWFDSGENFYGGKRGDDPVEILQKFDNSDRYDEEELKPFDEGLKPLKD
ncbi:MAG: tetratricopeptide repeat protein [Candidatus Nitronauta litoralis]|uniref:Tetratricopeptide repeat protein n=1 Tax=Candidatus Nitronauta litoralis TaxID=2705533 RepID=A0A7T0BYV5_9BACT|nr:MAG: tetratricopeptide repeat protein [Candidatus Nitronauta litoralis]